MNASRIAPWAVGLAAVAVALAPALRPAGGSGLDLGRFAELPVLEGGRVKPLDSVARNALLVLRGQQSFQHDGRRVDADEWLLDMMFRPEIAMAQPVFVVDDPDLLGMMGMPQGADRRLAMRALAPHLGEIERQAVAARRVDAKQRSRFQRAVVNLHDRMFLFYRLRNTLQPARSAGLAAELAAAGRPGARERFATIAQLGFFRALPPAAGHGWRNAGEALVAAASGERGSDAGLAGWARLGEAHRAHDAVAFGRAASALAALAEASSPGEARRARLEVTFNRAQPFYAGMVLYVLALLAVFASWLVRPAAVQRVALGLLAAGAAIHTAGLVARIALQGRPPVTNLYSSAIFVGWAAVAVGLVLERLHRRGFGTALAASAGFASLIVAHHLSGDGDTLEMMRAVLDSNFWLATHVVAITIGYSGTFLAGALGIGFAVRRHLVRSADPATTRALAGMTYGVLCFALFFSFLGTVLGGIWADQSWGRFWGWDPKENGALLIVLWNALIIHARWGGFVRDRGIMAMAIAGNAVTSLSWFGVNMLGIGLHAYGFMDSAFWALAGFVAAQGVLAALALAPPRLGWAAARARRGRIQGPALE